MLHRGRVSIEETLKIPDEFSEKVLPGGFVNAGNYLPSCRAGHPGPHPHFMELEWENQVIFYGVTFLFCTKIGHD